MQRRNTFVFLLSLCLVAFQVLGCNSSSQSPLSFSANIPTTGTVGTAYNATITVSGGSGSYTWTVTGLPGGLTASGTTTPTLTVSGTPTASGSFTVTITVTDSSGKTVTETGTLVIAAAPVLAVTSTSLANATVGAAYTATLTASGGTGPTLGLKPPAEPSPLASPFPAPA